MREDEELIEQLRDELNECRLAYRAQGAEVERLQAELERLRAMEQRARELGAGRANGPYGQGVNDACSAILGET